MVRLRLKKLIIKFKYIKKSLYIRIMLTFNNEIDTCGTSFCAYLESPYGFNESVARLYRLSNYNIFKCGDKYKMSFCISGMYKDRVFILYDYKCDGVIHIGMKSSLGVSPNILNIWIKQGIEFNYDKEAYNKEIEFIEDLKSEIIKEINNVAPKKFSAKCYYDEYKGRRYGFK